MATLPLSASQIRLCAGVPFQSDYKHSRWFTTRASQATFFNNRVVESEDSNFNFEAVNNDYAVNYPAHIDDIRNVNYMMILSGSRWFYCFVENLEYRQKNNTRIHFKVDVLQSYMFDFSFNTSFVNREHANTTTPNTIPEGINYGDAYDTVHTEHFRRYGDLKWLVIVSKSPLHEAQATSSVSASHVGSAQPLNFYLVPYLSDRYVDVADDMATPIVTSNGVQRTFTPPLSLLNGLYQSQTAVNNIVSLYITEFPGVQHTFDTSSSLPAMTIPSNNNQRLTFVEEDSQNLVMLHVDYMTDYFLDGYNVIENFRSYFLATTDPKLRVSPYRKIVIDDMKGNRIELDPENINNDHLRIMIQGGLGYNNQVQYAVWRYNYNAGLPNPDDTAFANNALINKNAQAVAIANNHLASYMQGNKNSLMHQRENIGMNAIFSGINNAVGFGSSIVSANPAGIMGSGLSGMTGMAGVQSTIAGIEAQMKDINNIPASIQNMGTDILYDYGSGRDGLLIMLQEIKPEYKSYLGDYFQMFGWKTNRLKIPGIRTRQSYNYVQTESVNISGTFNNEDMRELKSIFDNGITLWHIDDVGNYNVSNGIR